MPFVSGQVRVEECLENNDCMNNEICVGWKCVQAGEIPGANTEDNQILTTDNAKTKDNSVTSAWIIALGIIGGLIALGLILRKRK